MQRYIKILDYTQTDKSIFAFAVLSFTFWRGLIL